MVSSQATWDETGEAAAALRYAVDSYGPAVLSNAGLLGNVLSDLAPEAGRERHLLVAAARHNVSGMLVTRVGEGLGAADAARMVAGTLAAEQAVAADGARWAVAAVAATLGYPAAPPPEPEPPTLIDLPPVPESPPVRSPAPAPPPPTAPPARPLPPPPPWEQPPAARPPAYPAPVYQAPVYQPPVYAPPIVYAPPVFVRRRRSLLRRVWLLLGLMLGALLLWGLLAGSPHGTGGTTTTTSAPAVGAAVGAGTLAAS